MPDNTPHSSLDKKQFEELFRAYFVPLCNFAKTYVSDSEAARGITQEVFVNMWEKRQTIDPDKSLKSYLFSSVRNRSLNYIRDHKKFSSRLLDVEIADFETPLEQDDLELSELQDRVNAAVNSLPEKIKKSFVMNRYEGLKYREIADKLEISQKTVEAHISKALKLLREALKDFMIVLFLLLFQ